MNRDDVMALANQTAGQNWMDEAHIQRFAALVAAAEQDRCCKIVYGMAGSDNVAQRTVDAIRGKG